MNKLDKAAIVAVLTTGVCYTAHLASFKPRSNARTVLTNKYTYTVNYALGGNIWAYEHCTDVWMQQNGNIVSFVCNGQRYMVHSDSFDVIQEADDYLEPYSLPADKEAEPDA